MEEILAKIIHSLTCPVTHKNVTKNDGVLVIVPDNKNMLDSIAYCIKDLETLKKLPACPITYHVGEYRYLGLERLSESQWDHLQKLNLSKKSWNEFKKNTSFYLDSFSSHQITQKGMNFQNANLSGAKLSGTDFSGANFNGAILTETDFSHCNLSKAQLISANLRNANLENANLSYANFNKADLQGARLDFATLIETNFESAQLANANFNQVINEIKTESILQKPYEQ